jgi:chemotaxis protein CheD
MGELAIAEDPDETLVTYALGSCIAVMVHDPCRKVGGLIHYMLPDSSLSPEKAIQRPAMFADTGVPRLFRAMYERSCRKQDLVVKVAGGAKIHDDNGQFDIGRRNYVMLRKLFWKAGIIITAEDVGGNAPRTARLWVVSGRTTLTTASLQVDL